MKNTSKICLLVCGLAFSSVSMAQNPDDIVVSKSSKAYHEFRQQNTYPKFQLDKIKGMIKKVKAPKGVRPILSDSQFKALTVSEKFTYCMYYGEEETQNCDAMLPIKDEDKKIFGFIPGAFHDEYTWSPRQDAFFKSNRNEVVKLLSKNIKSMGRVGANFKGLVLRYQMVEAIPDLIKLYKAERKDHDILTVLMFLMKEGSYEPFIKSTSHQKLWGENAMYPSFIEANKANQDLVMSRAAAFFSAAN